ncbi:hypothetical protein, partial [Synechococcus lacustris]
VVDSREEQVLQGFLKQPQAQIWSLSQLEQCQADGLNAFQGVALSENLSLSLEKLSEFPL